MGGYAMPKHKQDAAASHRSANSLWSATETVLGMHTLMVSSYERLVEFRHEAAGMAIAEIAAYQRELLRAMGALVQVTWPHIHQQNESQFLELTRAWLELASQTQTAMVQVLRESILGPGQGMPPVLGQETSAFVERRRKSVVIDFPNRRVASG